MLINVTLGQVIKIYFAFEISLKENASLLVMQLSSSSRNFETALWLYRDLTSASIDFSNESCDAVELLQLDLKFISCTEAGADGAHGFNGRSDTSLSLSPLANQTNKGECLGDSSCQEKKI